MVPASTFLALLLARSRLNSLQLQRQQRKIFFSLSSISTIKMKSSSTPRSFSRTPSRRTNANGTSGGTPGLGQHSSAQQQKVDHIMGSIPENVAQQTSGGVADFINGTKTPSRTRFKNTGGRSSSRRHHVDTPTQSRSKSRSAAESERRSYDKSYTHVTDENDTSTSNRSFRYSSNNIRSSAKKTPNTKTKMSSSAKADGRIIRSPTEIVLSPVKKLFASKKQVGKAVKDASTQTEWQKEVVFTIRLNQDVTRSVQNRAQGDPKRGIVGTGDLRVMKCFQGSVTHFICQLVGDDGTLKFQAKIPDSSDAHTHMFLNPGVENSFVWDAYDSSREEAIINRAFSFFFDDGADMFTTLLHFFGGRKVEIVREFLKGGAGRFMPTKQTLPPHSIIKNEDDMDVNSDDEEHRPAPLNKEEEAELYGEVVEMSQAVW